MLVYFLHLKYTTARMINPAQTKAEQNIFIKINVSMEVYFLVIQDFNLTMRSAGRKPGAKNIANRIFLMEIPSSNFLT